MPKPTDPLVYASSPAFSSPGDPWDGQPTRGTLPGAVVAYGFEPGQRPPAEYLNKAIGVLADHTVFLHAITTSSISGSASAIDIVYETPPTVTVMVHAALGYDMSANTASGPGWGGVAVGGAGNGYAVQAKKNSAILCIPLNRVIPHGASITRIRAMVTLGAARAGADRVQVSWQQPVLNWGAPSASYGALEDTADDGGAAGGTTVNITCTPAPSAISHQSRGSANSTAIIIKAGNNASTNPDNVHGVLVTYVDPGVRNW